ncbi:MAG: hypothetical protein R3F39_09815 [Myxococcota bacterium]
MTRASRSAGLFLLAACCACGQSQRRDQPAPAPAAQCDRPAGSLLDRIRTITTTPSVWASVRLAAGHDREAFLATLEARVAQVGGDLLGHELADGLVRVHLRLPHATPPAVAALLARGAFGLHSVEDAAVHAMAETIRTRLPLAPDVTLERWEDGPAELVSDDRDALVRFATDLPIPQGTGWVFMGSTRGLDPADTHRALLVSAPRFTSADLERCSVIADTAGGPVPSMVLSFRQGALADFKAWTGAHVGRRIAFVFDDAVYTAPTVQEAIPGPNLHFAGGGGGDVATLVALIRGGPLSARAELVDFVFDMTPRAPTGTGTGTGTASGDDKVGDVAPE